MCAFTEAVYIIKQTIHSLLGNWSGIRKKSKWYVPGESPFAVDTDKDGQTTLVCSSSFLWTLEI